ncbi:MAG: sugar phosphate isomerase/epimerase [Cytophagales bacterium]|nr:sugar phosphate isomerase/epimerase [Cytophagales bacterium]
MEALKIQIANAPCSWGALEFELEGEAVGFETVLNEMRETGYAGTELGDWGFMPTDPAELAQELSSRNLELLGAFVPVALANDRAHAAGVSKALKVAELMSSAGYKDAFIVLADDNGTIPGRTKNAGRITARMGLREHEWSFFAKGAEQVASAVKEQFGMRTVFHHHCAGYVETAGELDALMELTNPDLLGLCLDMGHLAFGGGDPVAALNKYYDRIWHVHFKDYDPGVGEASRANGWDYFESVNRGVFCELGKGNVDFKQIARQLKEKGYQGWIVVEQDVLPGMGSPKVCAQNNRNYIRSLGL